MGYNERKLAKDHKNPSYDSDKDGIVESSQLPGVTSLDQGSMASGEFLKFNGTGLVGGTVQTSDLRWIKDVDASKSVSSGGYASFSLSTSSEMVLVILKASSNDGTRNTPNLRVNGDTGSNYNYYAPDGSLTTSASRFSKIIVGTTSGQSRSVFILHNAEASQIGINKLSRPVDQYSVESGQKSASTDTISSIEVGGDGGNTITAKIYRL